MQRPAPPNATSVKSRGSWPRSTETTRSAPTMLLSTIARMPRAASSIDRPSGSATFRIAARRLRGIERHAPAEQLAGKWPSTTCASVTVAAVPPRP